MARLKSCPDTKPERTEGTQEGFGETADLSTVRRGVSFRSALVSFEKHFHERIRGTAGPSAPLRFGRDDKGEGERKRQTVDGASPRLFRPMYALANTPNFPFAALDGSACAPFFKERHMKFVEPIGPNRKFGAMGHPSSVGGWVTQFTFPDAICVGGAGIRLLRNCGLRTMVSISASK